MWEQRRRYKIPTAHNPLVRVRVCVCVCVRFPPGCYSFAGEITCVRCHPCKEGIVFTASTDGTVCCWDTRTRTQVWQLTIGTASEPGESQQQQQQQQQQGLQPGNATDAEVLELPVCLDIHPTRGRQDRRHAALLAVAMDGKLACSVHVCACVCMLACEDGVCMCLHVCLCVCMCVCVCVCVCVWSAMCGCSC